MAGTPKPDRARGFRVRGVPGRRPSPRRSDAVNRVEMTPEQVQARIDAYRGGKSMSKAVVDFTREAVRDALPAAPQPVTRSWISYATSCVGTVAARCEEQGLPLDRTVVLDRATIDRFLAHECKHMTKQGRSSYRSRLDVVAGALLHGQNESAWPRATLSAYDTVSPWDDAQAARVALWTSGLRPASRRNRLRAALALALGAGLRRRDLVLVTAAHVARTAHGVQVTVPAKDNDPGRTVTVTAAWEQAVLDAAGRAGDGLLVAPDRTDLTVQALTGTVDNANKFAPAGDEFSPGKARNTWLVRHMAAGVPVPLLMAQAGLTTTAVLSDLLRFVPVLDDDAAAAAWMRGTRA